MKAIIDTNILVDCVHGVEAAVQELARYDKLSVSRIVWIEFLTGARTTEIEARRRSLLSDFELFEVDEAVSRETISLRQRTRLKLPDAIILATARVHGLLFVTRNHRDFPRHDPQVRIPY
ncbi:MAG: type II toxin-antitoxin system VapC family toxin [Methylacidiphilales bacterium]|nr:type II toxin-antitoxin system VapC family toxin [Candidatus Methylacidiphilales bacterium]